MVEEPLRVAPIGHDGTLVIRRTDEGDGPRLGALFDAIDLEDRYLRFFSGYRPDDRFFTRLARANEHGACQLIALVRGADGVEHVAGEAGAWPLPNGNGELAITVVRARRGWLGGYLLDALLEAAAAIGMANVEADVLTTNRRMLALLRSRGHAVAGRDGFHSMRLVISTTRTTPAWAPDDTRPRLLVEATGWWGADEARDHDALQVLVCPGPSGRSSRRPCPAMDGEPCPLVAGADAVLVDVHDEHERDALLAAHHGSGIPVVVRRGPGQDAVAGLLARLVAKGRGAGDDDADTAPAAAVDGGQTAAAGP